MPTGSFGSIGFVTEKKFTAKNYPRALSLRLTNHYSLITIHFSLRVLHGKMVNASPARTDRLVKSQPLDIAAKLAQRVEAFRRAAAGIAHEIIEPVLARDNDKMRD